MLIPCSKSKESTHGLWKRREWQRWLLYNGRIHSKAKVFSEVDANNGFWYVQLNNDSGFLTTFGTQRGRLVYRLVRMPFGISPAPEELQRLLNTALGGLQRVVTIFDYILINGVGETNMRTPSKTMSGS